MPTAATARQPDLSRNGGRAAKPPHPLLTLAEGRAIFELGSFYALRGLLGRLPRGDGHPVLVLPGFMAGDRSTLPMRRLLGDLGYDARGWGLGRNLRVDADREQAMYGLIDSIFAETGHKVSIVGWSLGGVFAREIAKARADKVRCVVTLGSPISNDRDHSAPRRLFEALNGEQPEPIRQGRFNDLAKAPPVPTTSIFTKTDGVVAWRGSVQAPGGQTENIELHASHLGLGVNPAVMVAVADRLAQPEGAWAPFDKSGWRGFVFRDVAVH
jgi:pimeloyl-ACP methyl ester carboxylesterase